MLVKGFIGQTWQVCVRRLFLMFLVLYLRVIDSIQEQNSFHCNKHKHSYDINRFITIKLHFRKMSPRNIPVIRCNTTIFFAMSIDIAPSSHIPNVCFTD